MRSTAARILDPSHGSICVVKDFIRDAADVGFGYLVDAIDRAEQFSPIAVACLIGGELRGQAFVIGQTANQIGL